MHYLFIEAQVGTYILVSRAYVSYLIGYIKQWVYWYHSLYLTHSYSLAQTLSVLCLYSLTFLSNIPSEVNFSLLGLTDYTHNHIASYGKVIELKYNSHLKFKFQV